MNDLVIKQSQLPKGHTSILSPAFKYVPAVRTDVAKTFARIREQRLAQLPTTGARVAVLRPGRRG